MTHKLHLFPTYLAEFIETRRYMPYEWGTNDCVTFAADGLWAVTGKDWIPQLRGTWHDAESAALALEAAGGLIKAVDDFFPRRPIKMFTQRGDIAMVRTAAGPSLAICVGGYVAAPGDESIVMIPLESISLAWEV